MQKWYSMPTFTKWLLELKRGTYKFLKFLAVVKRFYKNRDKTRWLVYTTVITIFYFFYLPIFVDYREKSDLGKETSAINHLGEVCKCVCDFGACSWGNIYFSLNKELRERLGKFCYSKNICTPPRPLMAKEIE